MNNRKYLICPGIVVSESDNNEHYISSRRLIELYKVRQEECIIVDREEVARGLNWADYVQLRPRTDGDYRPNGCYSYVEKGELKDCTCGECF